MRIDRVKLVAELTRQDMSQAKLAELVGVSRVTINGIKAGRACTDKVGHGIAKALQVPIETLLEN